MNIIDYIFLVVVVFYFWRGWSKGLLRSILGPVALCACIGYAYIYYQRTNNFLMSLGIAAVGPMVVKILLVMLVVIFKKADGKKEDEKRSRDVNDRLLGGLLNMSWILFCMLVPMIFLASVPFEIPGFERIRSTITDSKTMGMVSLIAGDRLPMLEKDVQPIDIVTDSTYLETLQELPEYQELIEHPLVKEVFVDEQVRKMIEEQDVFGLMGNEKFQKIMQDPELMGKFLKMAQKISKDTQK